MPFIFNGGEASQPSTIQGAHGTSFTKRRTAHHSLPSPSLSNSRLGDRDDFTSAGPLKLRSKSHSAPASPSSEIASCSYQPRGQKRKRSATEKGSYDQSKKRRASGENSTNISGQAIADQSSIEHWANTQQWPENFASMSQDRSSSSKRPAPSSSYSQSVKNGNAPRAYSAAFESVLIQHRVHMDEQQGRTLVREESKALYKELLQATYPEPQHTIFPLSEFLSVWQRLQNRNEARVFRDLTPLLVPSPELLYVCGHQELEHIAEEISTEWSKCKTLGGPQPKPDFTVGVSPSAFNEKETAKLKNYTAFERPTKFTDNLYFPFLMCEAKCGDAAINQADRQNAHSSSIAVNAIVELYRSVDPNKVADLSGQILVFSISHDNLLVKLYGHFATINGEQISFYRHPIASFVLNFEEGQGRQRTHSFMREVYHTFYPKHLQRIRDALRAMEDPHDASVPSIIDEEERTSGVQSSQETTSEFKVPGTPASKKQKNDMALLRAQMVEQQKQSREQLALLERQLEQQRQDAEKQRVETKEREALLLLQLEQQRKESEQQRKESEQQQKDLMDMLKQQSAQINQLLKKGG